MAKMAAMTTRLLMIILFVFVAVLSAIQYTESSYVEEACSLTEYPGICVESLAKFSKVAKKNATTWARAGVSVTLSEAKSVTRYMIRLRDKGSIRGKRYQMALSDCIELFGDTLDDLHSALNTVRAFKKGIFDEQIADLKTWVSAVISEAETCADGFEEMGKGKYSKLIRYHIQNVTCMASNSLALIDNLAKTGLQSLTPP